MRSAGTPTKVLSGLQARLHLLYRGTFPKDRCKGLVEQLLSGYEKQGFDRKLLQRIAFKVSVQYSKQ